MARAAFWGLFSANWAPRRQGLLCLNFVYPGSLKASRKEYNLGSRKDTNKGSYIEACLTPANVLTTLNVLRKKDHQKCQKNPGFLLLPSLPDGQGCPVPEIWAKRNQKWQNWSHRANWEGGLLSIKWPEEAGKTQRRRENGTGVSGCLISVLSRKIIISSLRKIHHQPIWTS